MSGGERERPAVLGVLVPCRDEAAVIGRKLANLAEGKVKTPDLGGDFTTAQVGDDIEARVLKS